MLGMRREPPILGHPVPTMRPLPPTRPRRPAHPPAPYDPVGRLPDALEILAARMREAITSVGTRRRAVNSTGPPTSSSAISMRSASDSGGASRSRASSGAWAEERRRRTPARACRASGDAADSRQGSTGGSGRGWRGARPRSTRGCRRPGRFVSGRAEGSAPRVARGRPRAAWIVWRPRAVWIAERQRRWTAVDPRWIGAPACPGGPRSRPGSTVPPDGGPAAG